VFWCSVFLREVVFVCDFFKACLMPNLIKFSWPFPKKKGKTIIVVGGESTTGLL
jgi:hypothetical protein